MKAIATMTAASILALAGAAAFAQVTPPAPPPAPTPGQPAPPSAAPVPAPDQPPRRPSLSRAEIDALTDARIAGIQAGLKLTAEQQRLWGPVEQALRATAAERATRMEERRARLEERRQQGAQQPTDLMQRLEQQSERVKERSDRLQSFVSALKPFWASLDDGQKRLLPVLIRQGVADAGRGWWRRGDRDRRFGPTMRHGMMRGDPRWL
jgi:hypothetical protein